MVVLARRCFHRHNVTLNPHLTRPALPQELMRGLSASTGLGAEEGGGGAAPAEPFISGNFEYGFGRMAARRKVYLFCNKAQDQRALTPASVQFLGVYKTDRRVRPQGSRHKRQFCAFGGVSRASVQSSRRVSLGRRPASSGKP